MGNSLWRYLGWGIVSLLVGLVLFPFAIVLAFGWLLARMGSSAWKSINWVEYNMAKFVNDRCNYLNEEGFCIYGPDCHCWYQEMVRQESRGKDRPTMADLLEPVSVEPKARTFAEDHKDMETAYANLFKYPEGEVYRLPGNTPATELAEADTDEPFPGYSKFGG